MTVITPLFAETLKDVPADPQKVTVVPSALYWALTVPLSSDAVLVAVVYLKRHTTVAAPPEKGILKVFPGICGILIPP